jgi:hypothetical protein
MHHNDSIDPVATVHREVEANNTSELHAMLAESRWEVRRQDAAEAASLEDPPTMRGRCDAAPRG